MTVDDGVRHVSPDPPAAPPTGGLPAPRTGATPGREPGPPAAPPAGDVPVVVLSGRSELAQMVHALAGSGTRIGLHRWSEGRPLPAVQLASELAAVDTGVVCIGDDVPLDLAFEVSSVIDRHYPDMTVILFAVPWPEIWRDGVRAGVRDIVDPNNASTELLPVLARASERAAQIRQIQATPPPPEPTARVIVVLSPKGGSGKTMVSSNLTVALAALADGPVALVDLDVQFGDSASALGLIPEHTLGQVALSPEVELTALKVLLTPHEPSGAYVLCSAASPEEGEAVTDRQAVRIVELLRQDFACVVIDTPAGLDERTLGVLERATDLVLVSTLDVSSIRNLGKEIDALDRLGLVAPARHFVLNRADAHVGIDPSDVEAALGVTIDAAVPSSRTIPLTMNQGRPVVLEEPASPTARELTRFAHRFVGDEAAMNGDRERPQASPGAWFRRLVR